MAGGSLTCEFPVTLAVTGDPASLDLDAVGVAVEEALVAQLRVCRERLASRSDDDVFRPPALPPWADPHRPADDGTPDPDVSTLSMFSSFLIREGYVRQVAAVIGPQWRRMSQAELTALLARTYTEEQIRERFLAAYLERTAVKSRFRTASVVSAVVLGLLWAQDNLQEGDWAGAAAKVGGSGIAAWLFNRLLYARDPSVAALMARAPAAYGRWFQSAAKSNRFVNFVVRDVNRAVLMWEVKGVLMSGGSGPNFPGDVILDVDMDDESTWRPPPQLLLDFGFDIYYRQIATERWPQAAAGTMYLGMVEGSRTFGLLRALDIAPSQLPGLAGRLYRVIGHWDPIAAPDSREVTEAERVLVLTTGKRSGTLIGLGGHYHEVEIIPANPPAVALFAGVPSVMVPQSLLRAEPLPPGDPR